MAVEIISEEMAIERLREAAKAAGGINALARRLGVTPSYISQAISQRNHITGKLSAYLGLQRVYAYQLTGTKKHPDQERYENERRNYLAEQERNGMLPHRTGKGIRSVKAGDR